MSLVHSTAPCRRSDAASGRRRARRALAALCVPLVATAALTGCSSDDDAERAAHTGGGTSASSAPQIRVRTTVTRVHGELSKAREDHLVSQAGRLITAYVQAAYFHQRPGSGYRGSFPGFTRGARTLALRDTKVASDRTFAGAAQVKPRGAVAYLSVVAPNGRPVGVTARLVLDVAVVQGDRTRWKQVTGRLLLSPGPHQWRIFGYDLAMGPTAPRKGDHKGGHR